MRALFDRFGCLVQIGVGALLWFALDRVLPGWAAVGVAGVLSYPATWLLAMALGGR
jgi:hypothetical protein